MPWPKCGEARKTKKQATRLGDLALLRVVAPGRRLHDRGPHSLNQRKTRSFMPILADNTAISHRVRYNHPLTCLHLTGFLIPILLRAWLRHARFLPKRPSDSKRRDLPVLQYVRGRMECRPFSIRGLFSLGLRQAPQVPAILKPVLKLHFQRRRSASLIRRSITLHDILDKSGRLPKSSSAGIGLTHAIAIATPC